MKSKAVSTFLLPGLLPLAPHAFSLLISFMTSQQSGPASTLTPERDAAFPEGFSASPTPRKAKPKLNRKDRAKRLLLGLASRHLDAHDGSDTPAALTWGGGRGTGGDGSVVSPGGSSVRQVSPLLTASDSATVRPGMVLTSVAARGGQGVSEEAVDTLGMGIKEAIEALVRYERSSTRIFWGMLSLIFDHFPLAYKIP